MGLLQERPEVAQRPVGRVDLAVVGDVVAVVAQRRGIEGQQPQRGDPELLEVVELVDQAAEVADAVAVAVVERPHVELVDDRVLVPVRLAPTATAPARGWVGAGARRRYPCRRRITVMATTSGDGGGCVGPVDGEDVGGDGGRGRA